MADELCRFLLLASLFPFAVSARAQAPDIKAPPSVSRSGPTVVYDGFLNDAGLQKLTKILEADEIRELQINSGGGAVDAGIKVGNLVFDKALDVIVAKSCFSSCANYVFTAGRRKKILPGAIVAWHGSILQKNFRERQARLEEKIKTSGLEGLSAVERSIFEAHQRLVPMQKHFFDKVGVNEYVTRLGQEPIHHKVAWTISIADMERFGIRNVEGPPWYGWPSYCSEWILSSGPRPPVKCLKLTPEMLELMN